MVLFPYSVRYYFPLQKSVTTSSETFSLSLSDVTGLCYKPITLYMKHITGSIQPCCEAPSPSIQCMFCPLYCTYSTYNQFTDQVTLFGKAASLGR